MATGGYSVSGVTMSQHVETFEEEFSNWTKAVLGLQKARDGSISYIKRTIEPFVDKLKSKHTANQMEHFQELLIQVTVNGDVKKIHLHRNDGTKIRWLLDRNTCTTCVEIFEELLDMFIDSWCPCKKWITNSQKEQVEPISYWWILAKMYIAKPEIIDAVGPEEVEPLAIFNLIKHCKLFDAKLRSVADVLVLLRNRLMHSVSDRLTKKEMDNSFDSIKEFLKQVAGNPTEATDIINEVEMLEERTVILYDENGTLSELAKEALCQQDKGLNADFEAHVGIRGKVITSLAASNIAVKQEEMKHAKKYEELMNEKEDIQRKYEELLEKVRQPGRGHGASGDQQKRLDIYKLKSSKTIQIKDSEDIYKCCCEGCCLTPDNQLLVTDEKNKRVKRIDTSTMAIVDSCLLDSQPRGIVCINGQEAAVACQSPNKIQFVSIGNNMNPTRKIDTSHSCYGVAFKNDHICVTDEKCSLYVYDMNGKLLKKIVYDDDGNEIFSMIGHIAFNESGKKMFVCDSDKGLVCFDSKYNYLCTIKDNDLFGALCVCTDSKGNVFVVGCGSYNVVQFNEDGKKIGIVVRPGGALNEPLSICFHPGPNRMYVTMLDSDTITMHEFE